MARSSRRSSPLTGWWPAAALCALAVSAACGPQRAATSGPTPAPSVPSPLSSSNVGAGSAAAGGPGASSGAPVAGATDTPPATSGPTPSGSSGPTSPTADPAMSLATVVPGAPVAPGGSPPDPFAHRRVVAYYGAPGTAALGVLGTGTPTQAWRRLDAQARVWDRPGRPAVRTFELIAAIASDSSGADGRYRNRVGNDAIAPYLRAARAGGGTLLLDIQPGRSDFLDEARALQGWLSQPDVGLALDPEWRMGPDEVPGKVIGSVDASEVDAVSDWLERLTVSHHLPPKLFVVHQFTPWELRDEADLADRPHLHEIVNVDGFGEVADKVQVYRRLAPSSPYPMGLKLFYRQDPVLMTPRQVLALRPAPQLVDYQ